MRSCGKRYFGKHAVSGCLGILATLIFLAAGGCQFFGSQEYVATVDDERISLDDFNERMEKKLALMQDRSSVSDRQLELLKLDVLGELADEQVMVNRARKLSLSVNDGELKKRIEEIRKDYTEEGFEQFFKGRETDYHAWKEKLRRRLLLEKLIRQDVNAKVSVTDEEVSDYYKKYAAGRMSEERVHLSQIVLQDREKAEAVLQRLKNGEDFSAVAREVSAGPEAEKGGDLGTFPRGVLPETFDNVVFSLPPGKVSKVVETPYGYHIFKVLEKERRGRSGFAGEKEKIRVKLKREKEDQEYVKWLEQLRTGSIIRVNEAGLQKADGKKDRPENK